MRLVTLGIVLTLGLAPATHAQSAPDAFDLCAREKDSTTRLACFDRQLAARRAATAAAPAQPAIAAAAAKPAPVRPAAASPAAAATNAASTRAPDSEIGLEHKQLRRLHPDRPETGLGAVLFEAKVVRVLERRPLIYAFELDNGQVWEQIETVTGLWVKPKETVTIRQGLMGGFILKSADGPTVRVHRTK
jgi:hypothetical protein